MADKKKTEEDTAEIEEPETTGDDTVTTSTGGEWDDLADPARGEFTAEQVGSYTVVVRYAADPTAGGKPTSDSFTVHDITR